MYAITFTERFALYQKSESFKSAMALVQSKRI